jgi:Nuclease-related domain
MSRLRLSYADRVGAGKSADRQYQKRYRSWRTRTRLAVLVAMVPVVVLMLGASFLWPSHRALYLGVALGSSMTLPFLLGLAAPEHIDRWRRGADAEKWTAKELRALTKQGWTVIHDISAGSRGNRDHVAVAPSGEVFLLDTKAPGGIITVEHGVLRVRWIEDPDDGYKKSLTKPMKGAAAALADQLAPVLGQRPWVTPVVVIWGRWDGAPHQHDRVAWVHGKVLAERLAEHAGHPDPAKHASVSRVLQVLKEASGSDAAMAAPRAEPAGA